MIFLGIDPGASGGLAWMDDEGPIGAIKMKDRTPLDIYDELCVVGQPRGRFAVLEKVSAMPRQGVASTFKFGRHYGMCEMALVAAGIPYELVAPGVWQRKLGCLSGGDKNVTKAKAQALFPSLRITHATADALLLAEYARRLYHERYGSPQP